jgi:hypothetical protein
MLSRWITDDSTGHRLAPDSARAAANGRQFSESEFGRKGAGPARKMGSIVQRQTQQPGLRNSG